MELVATAWADSTATSDFQTKTRIKMRRDLVSGGYTSKLRLQPPTAGSFN